MRILKFTLPITVLFCLAITAKYSGIARADTYAPADSLVLTVGCLDTTFLDVADPDSVWFKWWRDVEGQTIVDSEKVTSGVRTGFFRHKIKASDASHNMGTYVAEAIVYKDGKSGIKTWTWTVKAGFDSLTNAILDANKANFRADLSGFENLTEPVNNARHIYVKTDGDDDSSGLSWNGAVASLRTAESKCSGSDEYFIHVAPGTYSSQCCTVDASNLHIVSTGGWQNTRLEGSTGNPIMSVKDNKGLEVSGFTFIHDGATYSDGIWIARDDSSLHFHIHHNAFKRCYRGLNIDTLALHGIVEDNHFTLSDLNAIRICGKQNIFRHNYIDSVCGPGASEAIILIWHAQENIVYNNVIRNAGFGYGIRTWGVGGPHDVRNNLIVNNYVGGTTDYSRGADDPANWWVANHGLGGIDTLSVEEEIAAVGYHPDSTLLDFLRYVRNNQDDYKATVVKTSGGYIGQCTTVVSADSVRKTYLVDSLEQAVTAQVDTSQIKTMNENNLWGANYIWNYESRTLSSEAGTGANSVIVRCKQSSDSSNIALAQIQVLDSAENSTIGLLTSDSQGRGFFALDNGSYCVRMHKPGWQFAVPETLKISGNEDTTYYADAFDPGSPPQASLCRVYGWIHDINDQPMVGAKIEASIKTIPLRYQNIIISPYYKSTTTDDQGYWYLDLYPNSALSPYDTKYVFFLYSSSGTILRIETTVPDQASWELQW